MQNKLSHHLLDTHYHMVIMKLVKKNVILKSLLPNEVKRDNTIDDFRLKSKLTSKKTNRFTKKSFSIQY